MNIEKLSEAGIDAPSLMQRIMNNEKLLVLILTKFTEDKTYEALLAAAEARDKKTLEHTSHTLKGMCGNLSHTALFELFKLQVVYIRADELDDALALMPEIKREYTKARETISRLLSEA